jgi:protoheme IX farnesyltransferase
MLADYIKLTSPGITLLVMLTGFVGMWIGSRGMYVPSFLILWSLLGIGLASAGASVFNNCYDRDIDRLMSRTYRRPIPSGKIKSNSALIFGLCLSAASLIILILFVNTISAILSLLSIFIYSYLYTVVLKRHTPLATEIGGISGAIPPVIGWAAVRGSISFEALLLFSIMFLWQPPHFWSLALRHREDYKTAGIPTMSVAASSEEVNLRSLIYVSALVMVSLLPYFIGMFGRLYLFVSVIAGIIYLSLYFTVIISKRDMNKYLFCYSIIYLSLIFLSMFINFQV